MTENWLPIPGYEGLYSVSDQGQVRREPRTRGRWAGRGGQVLKTIFPSNRYQTATLINSDGEKKNLNVHILVASAFLGPRNGAWVLHHDDNKNNNTVKNLYYGTASENMADLLRNGKHHFVNRTHCVKGHPFDEANTYLPPRGGRQCRECREQAHIRHGERRKGSK